jgi:flagellar motor switch protein FliG
MNTNNFVVEKMDLYKKTALVLYGLNPSDKDWLLSHLTKEQCVILSGHLKELEALGIQPVEQDVKSIIENFQDTYTKVVAKEDHISDLLEGVDSLELKDIFSLLDGESDDSIALILAVSHWSWAPQFLSMLTPDKRDKIGQIVQNKVSHIAPGIRVATINFLHKKLVLNE